MEIEVEVEEYSQRTQAGESDELEGVVVERVFDVGDRDSKLILIIGRTTERTVRTGVSEK
jgi:hypothetical protein